MPSLQISATRTPALARVGLAACLAACLALAGCSQPAARAAQHHADGGIDAGPDASAPAHGSGARISGVIQHPAQAVPAMRICAISDKSAPAPAPDVCIDTAAGTDDYTLDGLQPGTYQIVARVARAGTRVGGHVRPVQCIRAPCPEMLAEVTVAAGEHRKDIDLNGFYDAREDFPAVP